jgi:dephospho-CoA kinase
MKFIGITGGVGAGKSAILSYLANKAKTKVLL